MKTIALLVIALLAGLVSFVAADDDFRAEYAAAAPGDDSSTRGYLELEIDDGDDDDNDAIKFKVELYNAIDVTGVHLHLRGNSSNGLFGGPLVLALTNTTAANNRSPVSSRDTRPLKEEGERSERSLAENPQREAVRARLVALGLPGNPPTTNSDLINLIKQGYIYTDVHTLTRVSPQGLTRGLVTDREDRDDGDEDEVRSGNTVVTTGDDDDREDEEEGED